MGKVRKAKINKIIQEKIGSMQSKDDLPGSYTKAMSELAIKAPGILKDLDYSNQLGDDFEIPYQKFRNNRLRLDLRKFGSQLSKSLMKSYTGHCVGIYHQGVFKYSWTKGYARDSSIRWHAETNMHIASLSKFLTALGMIRCLELNGVKPTDLLIDYLPKSWTFHAHTKTLTFHDLLRHRTRFEENNATAGLDLNAYTGLKKMVSMPPITKDDDNYYNNANYGLCRVLISLVSGTLGRNDDLTDQEWEQKTTDGYLKYMQKHVFGPAGVTQAKTRSDARTALAYSQPYAISFEGSDYGDYSSVSGGFGWFISVKDYLKVLNAFNKRKIVSSSMRRHILENTYGVYPMEFKIYANSKEYAITAYQHNGSWSGSARGIRTYFYLIPEYDIQIVMYVNSAHPENSKQDNTNYPNLWESANNAFRSNLFKSNLSYETVLPISLISKSSGKALTIERNSLFQGGQLVQDEADGRLSQRFFADLSPKAETDLSNETYTLVSGLSGLALESYRSAMDGNVPIVQYPWSGRRTQQFYFERKSDGSNQLILEYRHGGDPVFHLALDVAGNSAENGAQILQFDVHDGDNQKFWVAAPIKNRNGLVIDISGGLADELNELIGFPMHGEGNQMFRIERLGGKWVRIVALNGKVFDISGNKTTNGAPVILYPWHGGYNQQFEIIQQENGFVKFKARHSGKMLELANGAHKGKLIQADSNRRIYQQWKLHPLQYGGL